MASIEMGSVFVLGSLRKKDATIGCRVPMPSTHPLHGHRRQYLQLDG